MHWGSPSNRHRKGEGGVGAGMPRILLCTVRSKIEGGREGQGGRARTPGGAWSNTAGHRDGTGKGSVGQGMLCKLLSIVPCLVLRQRGLE